MMLRKKTKLTNQRTPFFFFNEAVPLILEDRRRRPQLERRPLRP